MFSAVQPDEEMKAFALECLKYANSYLRTIQRDFSAGIRRFDNNLIYNLATMSFEKYFVGLLARYDFNATSHLPLRMYKEAADFETELTENMKQTAIQIGSFEGICSIDGFGYRTPSDEELYKMIEGLEEIQLLVEKRMAEIKTPASVLSAT
jgi:hypothetical protein